MQGRSLLLRILQETHQAEIQQVVPRHHQQVVVQAQRVDGELDVPHGAEARLVRGGSVVQDGDRCPIRSGMTTDVIPGLTGNLFRPVLEDRGELVVGDDDVLVDEAGPVDVVDEPVQDGLLPYLQEGLGEVFGKRVKPRGVARGEDQAFHKFNPSALSQI